MARPGRPERNRTARSFRQLRRFHHVFNSDKVFGTHRATPQLMDKWQSDAKHKPVQEAAHSRWFASVYLRKWRLPADNEALTGPLLCELAIARQDPLEHAAI